MALVVATGFEHGSNTALINGNTNSVFATGASGTIVTTSPHGGTYCWERNAAGQLLYWDTNIIGASMTVCVMSFWVYFPSPLPSAEVAFAEMRVVATQNPYLTYNNTTGKFKVHNANGGINVDLNVGPTANTWHHIEWKVDVSTSTTKIDTWIDGAPQTQATVAASADTIGTWVGFPGDTLEIGNNAGTFRIDDVAIYTHATAIATPIGQHSVKLLSVDPAGTIVLSPSNSLNFNTFVSNGTLTAFNVATARNNIDELPPVFGASSDGFVQITAATTEYVEIPMTSYTLDGGETIAGARMCAPGWATSGTAATLGFRSYNGTTETILQAGTVDPAFDNATTTAWVCKMLTLADIDTQTELNALAFRVGFSNDATPDIGIHAIYAEVAILVPWPPGVWRKTSNVYRQAVNRAATF